MFHLLAQTAVEADKGLGLLKTVLAGGVPLICLVIAVAAVGAAIYQYRSNAKLEESYRSDLDARAKKAEADADKRLTEAKAEAKLHAGEIEKLNDKLRNEAKDQDVTIAAATRMLERCAEVMGRVERKLDDGGKP